MALVTHPSRFIESVRNRITVDLDSFTGSVDGRTVLAKSLPELRSLLTAAVYSSLHAGNPHLDAIPSSAHQDLADRLVASIPTPTVLVPAASAVDDSAAVPEGSCVINVQGLRVVTPNTSVVRNRNGEVIAVRTPSWRSRTTPGYLLTLGGSGKLDPTRIARLYLAVETGDLALRTWPTLLAGLDAVGVAYQAKALSSSASYPRFDAMVVYVEINQLPPVIAALEPISELLEAYVPAAQFVRAAPAMPAAQIMPAAPIVPEAQLVPTAQLVPEARKLSVFVTPILPGIGVAHEPQDTRTAYQGMSFGQHRSRVLVDALLSAHQSGLPLQQTWQQESELAGIDHSDPGVNHTRIPVTQQNGHTEALSPEKQAQAVQAQAEQAQAGAVITARTAATVHS